MPILNRTNPSPKPRRPWTFALSLLKGLTVFVLTIQALGVITWIRPITLSLPGFQVAFGQSAKLPSTPPGSKLAWARGVGLDLNAYGISTPGYYGIFWNQ